MSCALCVCLWGHDPQTGPTGKAHRQDTQTGLPHVGSVWVCAHSRAFRAGTRANSGARACVRVRGCACVGCACVRVHYGQVLYGSLPVEAKLLYVNPLGKSELDARAAAGGARRLHGGFQREHLGEWSIECEISRWFAAIAPGCGGYIV